MPLMRYFEERKIEILYWEIKLSTGIKLKTIPEWLINKIRLEEYLESGNKRRSAIVITVRNKAVVLKFCAKRLKFGKTPKIVEKY